MKNVFCLVVAVVCAFTVCHSQNVVSNGSFEVKDGTDCPTSSGLWPGASPLGWTKASFHGFSPDYFHTCNQTGSWSPNGNGFGCELPLDGASYTGFLSLVVNAQNTADPSGSEYIQQQISLTGGQEYYVEFWVSSADGGNNPVNTYTRNLGMFFTNDLNTLSNGANIGLHHLTPQIPNVFPSTNYYTSTQGWTRISGTFTPGSSGTWFIIIGNFDPGINQVPASTNTTPNSGDRFGYYYLDAVTIIPSYQAHPDYSASITGDESICSGTSRTYTLNLLNSLNGATVSWSAAPSSYFQGASSGSGTSATLTPINVNATATITFTINACGAPAYQRVIALGTEVYTVNFTSQQIFCTPAKKAYYHGTFEPLFSATNLKWYAKDMSNPNNPFVLKDENPSPEGSNGSDFPLGAPNRYYTIRLVVTTPCGTVQTDDNAGYQFAPACTGGGGGGGSLRIFPNPTSQQVQLEFTPDEGEEAWSGDEYSVKLLDKSNQQRKMNTSTQGRVNIDVSDLPSGKYFLHIQINGEVIKKPILIEN